MRRVMVVLGMLLVVGSLGVLAQPAGAQSADPYLGRSTTVPATDPITTVAVPAPQVQAAAVSQGALPITGSDVLGLVGLATILILGGAAALGVRRRVGRTTPAPASALLSPG